MKISNDILIIKKFNSITFSLFQINQLRQRVNEYMGKFGKGGKSVAKRQVKTLANVSARAGVFK